LRRIVPRISARPDAFTDGANGIAKDEPTRVVREDPDRAGLLMPARNSASTLSTTAPTGTVPAEPAGDVQTDIKIAHKDLALHARLIALISITSRRCTR
jgi:hypothetical protein